MAEINTRYGFLPPKYELNVDIQRSSLEMSGNGNLNVLDLSSSKPRVEMDSTDPTLQIDQRECFGELGSKTPEMFMSDTVSFAKSMMSSAVSRMVSQGNDMIDIHTGVDAVAEQADYNAFGMFDKEWGVNFKVPYPTPSIRVDPGTLNYRFVPGEIQNNTHSKPVSIQYTPGRVSFYTRTV